MTTLPANQYIGEVTPDCTFLFPFGGKWYAPNKEFRKLLGAFGETLVRNIIGNSAKEINPATLSPELAEVVHRVCAEAKKGKK